MNLFAIFLERVIYFSVTFPACKAITENGRRHHKYANCCQITGFAGSALGSGIAAAGGIRGARPPLRARAHPAPAPLPSAAQPPRGPRSRARQRAPQRGKRSSDSHSFSNSCLRSRSLPLPFLRVFAGFATSFLSQGVFESSSFALRSTGSLIPPLSNYKVKIFVSPSAHLRGAHRHGVGKGPARPCAVLQTYSGKSGDTHVWICSLKDMLKPSLF